MLNSDYRDMLSALAKTDAEYLLVGAYALACHGLVRATRDLDLWVRATDANAEKVVRALVAFGAPADRFSAADFTGEDQVIQIGVEPVRIDFLTSVSGLEFDAAWKRRQVIEIDGTSVPVLSVADLVINKRASARPQDLVDLKWLDSRK